MVGLRFSNTDYSMTFDEAKNTIKKLFEQAVKRQMVSDVEVGSYLSEGSLLNFVNYEF